jgi:hypothetical protein
MTTNLDKFNDFYKLKTQYESQINKEKSLIISNKKLSWKEKRLEFKKFKPKCINCKRPVGSLFYIKYDDENTNRIFKASCGDLVDPCNFLIEMTTNQDYLYTDMIKTLEDELNELKDEVIKYKNMIIFGYVSAEDTIDVFDKIKENINELSSFLEYNINSFNNIVNNKERNAIIIELKENIYNTYIINLKDAMTNFVKTNDVQYVRDAVDIYVNILTPKLKQLMELQYKTNFVEFNEDTNTYHLIQKKYTAQDIEIPNEIIVENYQLGTGKLSDQLKSRVKPKSSLEKIQKMNNGKKIVVDDEASEVEKAIRIPIIKSQQLSATPSTDEPIFKEEEGGVTWVTWNDITHQKLWMKLDPKYKDALIKDVEWLKKTMKQYVKQYKDKKDLTFVPPDNLIFPPNKTHDEYDFGNPKYNEIFNKLPEFQQNNLLSLPLNEDENKGMKNAINSIIASELKFRPFTYRPIMYM